MLEKIVFVFSLHGASYLERSQQNGQLVRNKRKLITFVIQVYEAFSCFHILSMSLLKAQKLPKTVNFISSTLVPAEHAVSTKQISLASVFKGIPPVIQTKIHPHVCNMKSTRRFSE
jgi:hypothetical protein